MAAIGIDIGGTFTDLVLLDEEKQTFATEKVLTTPDDPPAGVMTGFSALMAKSGLAPRSLQRLMHATTLVANALIERRGARTAFLTTQGFRDLLEMGREKRPDLYDIFLEKPQPLVPRRLCHTVSTTAGGHTKGRLGRRRIRASCRSWTTLCMRTPACWRCRDTG